jgi:hypothetical protein
VIVVVPAAQRHGSIFHGARLILAILNNLPLSLRFLFAVLAKKKRMFTIWRFHDNLRSSIAPKAASGAVS